jgi:hypothetical protein
MYLSLGKFSPAGYVQTWDTQHIGRQSGHSLGTLGILKNMGTETNPSLLPHHAF